MNQRTRDRRRFLIRSLTATGIVPTLLSQVRAETPPAPASQPNSISSPYDDQNHTEHLFRNTPRRFTFSGSTSEDFLKWQREFRPRLCELLGLTDMSKEVPFKHRAERVEHTKKDGYTQEKWYLWTEPDIPLPIWVLIPDKPAATPMPLVLTPHGHNVPELYLGEAESDKERQMIQEGDRDIAVQAVRQGYLCVHPTTRGFGETRRDEDRKKNKLHSCRTGLMHGMLFGRTMIGYRAWDISRILDWIVTQHDIDQRKIAITGNSGGGTTSLFASACDPRITVAVPSSYFCTFQGSIGRIHHCECNYIPGLLREAEMYDVAGLIAPRPFLAMAGQHDRIFPIASVKKSFARLKQIYRAAGVEDQCQLYVGQAGHRYYKNAAWPFIRKLFAAAGGT